jgi:hypothetical protein
MTAPPEFGSLSATTDLAKVEWRLGVIRAEMASRTNVNTADDCIELVAEHARLVRLRNDLRDARGAQ